VKRFPRQRFVLYHLAKPPIKAREIDAWSQGISRLATYPNLFCKLSGLVTEADWRHWKPEQITPYLDVAFDNFGPDRLMIGSDWPVRLVAASYSDVIGLVRNYVLGKSPACLDRIFAGNAERFWRLRT